MSYYIISAIIIIFFFCACSQSDEPQKEYKLIEVIDGDTIYVRSAEGKRLRLRYIGIDCPEKGDRYYYLAREENKKLLSEGRIKFEFDNHREDQYGRLLAYVFVDNFMVNVELLKQGLARFYDDPHNKKYRKLLKRMEKKARKNNRGLWNKSKNSSAHINYHNR
jgi:micrococcal nuclease